MKNNKGFSLVELMVVIIIVGILSFVSFNMYKRYKKNAIMTEGKALLSAIIDAEEIHYSQSEDNSYFTTEGFVQSVSATVTGSSGINAATNIYFRSFDISEEDENTISIETIYEDSRGGSILLSVRISPNSEPVYSEEIS